MDTKALRQKILDLAIRGKLVPQDPNDEPASVLLERIRAQKQQMVREGKLKSKDIKDDTVIFVGEDNLHYEKFASGTIKCIADEIPYELPEGWEWARLGSIADTNLGKMLDAEKNKGVPRPYLRNINVRWGSFDLSDLLEMRIQDEEVERYSVRKGDLIVCEGGEPGRCAIWEDDDIVFFQKALHRIRPYLVLSEYLFIVISALSLSGLTEQYFTGTTIKHLTGQSLKALLIPIPTIHEQQDICKIVNKALMLVDCIESNRKELITVISSTKAYILDLAIRGQLVQQDPTDEPATVLLARIRKERENLIKQGNTKREGRDSVIYRGEDNSYYRRSPDGLEDITDDLPYDIPDSWEWTSISELFSINPRNKIAEDMVVSFIPMPLIDDGYSGCHRSETKEWKSIKTGFSHFQNGDIGIAKITPCFENRKSVIFRDLCNGYGAGTTELHILRPQYRDCVLPEYALALLKSERFIQSGVQAFTGAVGQQRIGKDYVMNTYFPLPPYAEQRRIIDRINKLFTLIATIESAL